jgi:hypothetical protein
LQHNWYKMQDYAQNDQLSYVSRDWGGGFYKVTFQYLPKKEDIAAALNFHLTRREKQDVADAINNPLNMAAFERVKAVLGR